MRKRLGILFALMLFFTTTMLAQMTTSGINGKVMAGGEAAIGATVTAVHEPSGTTYNTVTNETAVTRSMVCVSVVLTRSQ